ncbi:MAG: response regulator [Candidatus Eisenbacteria bacterium]
MKISRILVVDDDTVVRRMVARLLRDQKIETDLAATGEEALAKLESGDVPDAVLCDLYLPGISGLDVIEAIRANDAWQDVPIVVLTGRARGEMMVRAEALGDCCLTKPFSSVDLKDTIGRLSEIERRKAS